MNFLAVVFALICFFVMFSSICFAYVDPNTGGYIFQILFPILSAIAAGYLFFKNHIKKAFKAILGLFRKRD